MTPKRIAIFHNFMDNIGGAEIVCLTLARELNGDLYTTNIDEDKIKKMGFSDIKLKSIGRVPEDPPFRQQSALAKFARLNLGKKYDFYIIGGDWAVSAVINHKPNLWYVHAPMREIWDLYEYTRRNMVPLLARWFFDFWVKYNRKLVKKYVKDAERIVCNSGNTKKRVRRYLNREGVIVNPPVDTSKFHYTKNGDFWLSVSRLINHKRVDIQLEAFSQLKDERLVIVGSYEKARHFKKYADYVKSIKPENVEIKSWVEQKELTDLYANCKGFVATAHNEDFGMTVVEAAASGKPVIAPNEGGYKETVIDGVTGRLIDDIDADKLVEVIKEVRKNPVKYKDSCLEQAKKFDTKVFIGKIRKMIEQ